MPHSGPLNWVCTVGICPQNQKQIFSLKRFKYLLPMSSFSFFIFFYDQYSEQSTGTENIFSETYLSCHLYPVVTSLK